MFLTTSHTGKYEVFHDNLALLNHLEENMQNICMVERVTVEHLNTDQSEGQEVAIITDTNYETKVVTYDDSDLLVEYIMDNCEEIQELKRV